MTEREKRENAIYKMVIDTYGHLFESLPSYYEVVKDVRNGRYGDLAKLYDADYRKAEEVRKETARKIFKKLKEKNDAFKYEILSNEERKDITSDDFYYKIVLTSTFKELGFEVEE